MGAGGSLASDYAGEAEEPAAATKPCRCKPAKKKASAKNAKADGGKAGAAKPKRSGKGASITLDNLVETGFFATPRTLNAIVKHCEEKLATFARP